MTGLAPSLKTRLIEWRLDDGRSTKALRRSDLEIPVVGAALRIERIRLRQTVTGIAIPGNAVEASVLAFEKLSLPDRSNLALPFVEPRDEILAAVPVAPFRDAELPNSIEGPTLLEEF